jgi:ABC-type transport system substrate-binding protein
MSSEEKAPFTTTLRKSVKAALRKVAFDRDQPMGEIIEEGLAAIGITGELDNKDQSSENNSRRK